MGISNKFLKLVNSEISGAFSFLTNDTISEKKFPNVLKIAKEIPLFKSRNKLDCSNCRPISLLLVISKNFERILKTRIVSFLEKCSLLHSRQFGFRAKRITEEEITDIFEKIRINKSNKIKSICTFLDLKKAFDTVEHKLLYKSAQIMV